MRASFAQNMKCNRNALSSAMSCFFLTEFPPTLLCAHLLVLIFHSTTRYSTRVSELSS